MALLYPAFFYKKNKACQIKYGAMAGSHSYIQHRHTTLPSPLKVRRGFHVLVRNDQDAADLMQQLHTVICLDVSGRIAVKEFQPPIA
jgi:hypothetical protein